MSTDAFISGASFSTKLLHGDHAFANSGPVAPDISVTSTFRHTPYEGPRPPPRPLPYPGPRSKFFTGDAPSIVNQEDILNPQHHVYSRYTQPVSTRVEKVLDQICNGYSLTYRSGLSAGHAALLHYKPKRIAIRDGYHGFHQTIEIYRRTAGEIDIIDLDDQYQAGDLVWVETPLNPTGEARDIKYYADRAHAAGAILAVDATFAPPPLQDPFLWGADIVMHSATKYFGGHSDLLGGVLVVKTTEEWYKLWSDRTFTGNVLGSLEAFLLLRSIRTLDLRVNQQSASATKLAGWLHELSQVPKGKEWDGAPGGIIATVTHSSLQKEPFVQQQLSGGGPPTFSITLHDPAHAKNLSHATVLFMPATSLGGVESLMEHRLVSDQNADPRLIRLSIGLENVEDLKEDIRRALKEISKPSS